MGLGILNKGLIAPKGGSDIDLSGLFAYYRYNVDASDYFDDNNGTTVGDVTYSADDGGEFQNSGGIQIPDANVFSFTDGLTDKPFSISLWFRFNVMANAWILSKRVANYTGCEWQFTRYGTGSSPTLLLFSSGVGTKYMGRRFSFVPTNGEWYHVIITYTGNGLNTGINNFYNGALNNGDLLSGGTYTGMTAGDGYVGVANPQYTGANNLKGNIKGLGFWNEALSAERALEIYNYQKTHHLK